jgi:curved DNA-binding protein CbpA
LKAYFAILGLEESASDVEIKRAYHKLALQHHPDLPKNADRVEECETMMARINEAYEKIRN